MAPNNPFQGVPLQSVQHGEVKLHSGPGVNIRLLNINKKCLI